MSDSRVAYGAYCSWWDLIQNASQNLVGLPCCPFCQGVLYECESLEAWFKAVEEFEAKNDFEDYSDFIEWLQGKCYPSIEEAADAFVLTKSGPPRYLPNVN